jgi:hypothetical protein
MTTGERGWRGLANGVLYTLTFVRSLDEAAVENAARNIIGRGTLRAGPQVYRDALAQGLASGAPLTGDLPDGPDEAAARDFLTRLLHRLDALRPWPEPPYLRQPIEQWPTFDHGRAIARVGESLMNVQDRIRERFEPLPVGDGALAGMILRLASGETVALLGSYERGNPVTLLQRDPGDPAATIAAFRAATNLPEDAVVPLT